ncbi:phosphoribosyltransferase domain-containing protein [Calothrix sp. FACHB-156]|nr:phosphoribosyltransferase domain-containing protein [Calothrix sp. FACHB-156]
MNLTEHIYWLQRENNPLRQTAVTFSYLGKLKPTNFQDLQECKNYLKGLLSQSILENPVSKSPLIIGLTESGIVPSALMYQNAIEQGINAQWLCSTRRQTAGLCFSESHSHSPNHILPLPESQPTELWFVEDEITTGKTILQLSINLCLLLNIKYIRFFALADTRSQVQIDQFKFLLYSHKIYFHTYSLIKKELVSNSDKENILTFKENIKINNINTQYKEWQFPKSRPALKAQSNILKDLPRNISGCIFVIGEAIDIGIRLVQLNPFLSFQHITLSPWKVDKISITNKLQIYQKYYLYNYKTLKIPIYILSDPIDKEIELEAKYILAQQGITVTSLELNSLLTAL